MQMRRHEYSRDIPNVKAGPRCGITVTVPGTHVDPSAVCADQLHCY